MPYFITQFQHPKKHRAGQISRDLKRIGIIYPNQHEAEKALYELMNKNRVDNVFLRIDRNVPYNPVVFADLNKNGGLVRFHRSDGYHWTGSFTLAEFKKRITRQEAKK